MRTHYESKDWLLLHIHTTSNEQNKAILASDNFNNYIVVDLNLAKDNTFYMAFDGTDCLMSEFELDEKYTIKVKLTINADDAIMEIGENEKVLFKRIQ
ncbi:MAG: hypothetical protein GY734_21740 [Herbaspirillum sp.]|uniref:hypothetical protein n=1 Tax=Herbaspirillum sp. TaxID=1890675 RepID=UPI00258512B9|nr:hypothetical protein [Herbaspirillum sp.]MCP3658489.1 hypothetical protein [Herbaspirillum sp.]MCP4033842.1 hypothetical protein [Herbaspirillum sp.]